MITNQLRNQKMLPTRRAKNSNRCACLIAPVKFPRRLDDFRYSENAKDLTIRTTDNVTEKVHAFPFIQVSSIFFELFEDAAQSMPWEMAIDVSSVDLPIVLDIAYTGVCKIDFSKIENLLKISRNNKIVVLESLAGREILKRLDICNAVDLYRLAQGYLCQHVQKQVCSYIIRNISDLIENGTAETLTVDEMRRVVADDRASILEFDLVRFLLNWATVNRVPDLQFADILEYVRFTKMSMEEYFSVLAHPEMERFTLSPLRPSSLDNGRRVHDPPMLTRSGTGRRTKRFRGHTEKDRISRHTLITIGGWARQPAGPSTHMETYNFLSDKWKMESSECPGDRAYHSLEIIDKQVYMVGGYDASPTYHSSLWTLDLGSMQWSQLPSMAFRRCYVSTVVLNGRLVALGGHDGLERHSSVEIYDPISMTWTEMTSMIFPRSDFAVVAVHGKIYAIGGFSGQEVLSSVEVYDPAYGTWELYSNMDTPRSGVKAVVLDGRVFILGGYDGTRRLKSVECFSPGAYNPEDHQVPDMNRRRSNFGVSVMEGKIYVSGGYTDPTVSDCCEVYCPDTNQWKELGNMNHQKSALSQITVPTHYLAES